MSATTRITAVGLLILAVFLALFAIRPTGLERVELVLLDARFNLRGPEKPTGSVGVVAFDSRSIDELGWRRDVIAEVIERLNEAGAAAIGVDIVFSEPGVPGQDARLESAVAGAPTAILGFYFRTRDEVAAPGNATLEESLDLVEPAKVRVTRLPAAGLLPVLSCRDVEPNMSSLSRASRHMGFFSAIKDLDGSVRRSALLGSCGGELYTSLSLAVAEMATGERAVVIGDTRGIHEIRLGKRILPTDPGGRLLINYRGPARTYPHYSVADLLADEIPRGELAGKILIVGTTEPGIMDVHPTPFDASFPGVEVHANIVDSILSNDAVRRSDALVAIELVLIIFFGVLLSAFIPRMSSALGGAVIAVLLLAGLVVGGFWAFTEYSIWFNLTYPALTLISVYLGVTLMQALNSERRSQELRNQFATYVSPAVVDEIVRQPDLFRLHGESRRLSILFSDIRGFTALSEQIDATQVAKLLNTYFAPMTALVKESGGTLDKYIGDALMAFWGAPLPIDNHPIRACETALAMRRALEELNQTRTDLSGMDCLRIGIGIHTADVVVGNMGSESRFQYTVIGDGVNLCSRLEGLNRYYGTEIIASSDLVDEISDGILRRELDTIRVKGRREGVRIYEILGRDALDPMDIEFHSWYADALRAYRAGNWAEARQALASAISVRGEDAGCEMLLGRVHILEKEPPAEWTGVWTFESK
ncbi:MAG: adenylate/guanylate cyclase domain-containing protein [bacterium]|nr:adenylate/guanylate cyclase domain-containing protein [bacterium]